MAKPTTTFDERPRRLDIVTSHREQTLVHLSLSNGDKLTATEGHPFKTTDGWRDAILLKKGGKLLLRAKGDEPPGVRVADSDGAFAERVATIAEIRIERLTVPVFNLEVANAHTFYVGVDGALVHNGKLYLVPGSRTPSGKPYGGRTKHPNVSDRGCSDGRARRDEDEVGDYGDDLELGKLMEQDLINFLGGPGVSDNKRNELSPKPRRRR